MHALRIVQGFGEFHWRNHCAGIAQCRERSVHRPLLLDARRNPRERCKQREPRSSPDRFHVAWDAAGIGETRSEQRAVGDAPRKHAERVERRAEHVDALKWKCVQRRLESDDAAIRGRPYQRAVGLRTDRRRHLSQRDRGRRAGRRASGRVPRAPRIPRLAGMDECEFGCHRLAQHKSTRPPQSLDAIGVIRRACAGVDWRPQLRRLVQRCDDVLDADTDACQRTDGGAGAALGIRLARGGERALGIQIRPRQNIGVGRGDTLEERARVRLARELSRANRIRGGAKRQGMKRRRHGWKPAS